MTDTIDYRQSYINLVASLGCNEHNDCADDLFDAVKRIGIEVPEYVDDMFALTQWLGKYHGATTVGGEYPFYTAEEDDCKLCGRLRPECHNDYDGACPGDEGGE